MSDTNSSGETRTEPAAKPRTSLLDAAPESASQDKRAPRPLFEGPIVDTAMRSLSRSLHTNGGSCTTPFGGLRVQPPSPESIGT